LCNLIGLIGELSLIELIIQTFNSKWIITSKKSMATYVIDDFSISQKNVDKLDNIDPYLVGDRLDSDDFHEYMTQPYHPKRT
jgi:hypothetical protein